MSLITKLSFIGAVLIAIIAAWFSITGLMTLFAAGGIAIAIMATVLEVVKLITASLLYRNWDNLSKLLRYYLTTAVIILMVITSIGIFGFLSKGYLEQTMPVSSVTARIERYESTISNEQRKIDRNRAILEQLDDAVNTLISYDRISGPNGAMSLRGQQQSERDNIETMLSQSYDIIDQSQDEIFKLQESVRSIEAEIGPIKYVAEWFYGSTEGATDKAVRYLILLIVIVFDPLAVLLLIAANQSQMRETDVVNTIRNETKKVRDEVRFDSGLYEEELPPRPKDIKDD